MKMRAFMLGTAAHLCQFPTSCRFISDMETDKGNVQQFVNELFTSCVLWKHSQRGEVYTDFEPTLAELASIEAKYDENGVLSFVPKQDYAPCWTHNEATQNWLEMLGTVEGELVERQRKICAAISPIIPKYESYEGLYSYHIWQAFFAEIDTFAYYDWE